MSKRTSPGKKKRQLSAEKRSNISRKDAAARRRALAKRLAEESPASQESPQADPGSEPAEEPPVQAHTAAIPVKKTAIKRAQPTKKTAAKKAPAKKKSSFEILNKSPEKTEDPPTPAPEEKSAPIQDQPELLEKKESIKVSLKAPGARGPEDPTPKPEAKQEPEPKVNKPAAPERPKSKVPLRKETMRVSLKAPSAQEAEDPVPPPQSQPVSAPAASKSSIPLRKETMRVSLKAPGVDESPTPPAEPVAPESPVNPVAPEDEAYKPKEEQSVPVRKETIRVSLKAPAASEPDPMENWDILEPQKLSDVAKEDPNQKYAPPGLQETPAASLDQVIDPAQAAEPEPQPEPEEAPMSLDQALPLRKETMRVSVKAPFAGMAAAQAAAAREPILATLPTSQEPEPAPAVVLEQTTASVTVSAQETLGQTQAPQQSELNTPLPPQAIQPKKDLGSVLMTWMCIILGIIAAVMVYLAFFAE